MTSIVLEPYGKDHEAGLRQQLDAAGILSRQDGVGYFWRQLIDEPYRRNSAVIVARQGEMIVGIAVVMCRAYGRPEGRCSMIIVFEDWRRQGIGNSLLPATDATLNAKQKVGFISQVLVVGEINTRIVRINTLRRYRIAFAE